MKGTYFLGADAPVEFETRDMQFGPLSPTDVLMRVHACGVCGTDVHIYKGEAGSAPVTPPVVLGHEFSGIVTAVGSAVTTCRPRRQNRGGSQHVLRYLPPLPGRQKAEL